MDYRLSQQLGELLVVENLQAAAAGNLAHSCGMEAVVVITVTTLDEDTAVTQTFGIHLPTNIIQMDTCEEVAQEVFVIWRNRDAVTSAKKKCTKHQCSESKINALKCSLNLLLFCSSLDPNLYR